MYCFCYHCYHHYCITKTPRVIVYSCSSYISLDASICIVVLAFCLYPSYSSFLLLLLIMRCIVFIEFVVTHLLFSVPPQPLLVIYCIFCIQWIVFIAFDGSGTLSSLCTMSLRDNDTVIFVIFIATTAAAAATTATTAAATACCCYYYYYYYYYYYCQ